MRSTIATRTIRKELLPTLTAEPEMRGETRVWRCAVSRTWYEHPSQIEAYRRFLNCAAYKAGFTDAEAESLEANKEDIVYTLPGKLTIVDLGCGEAQKSIALAEAIKKGWEYCEVVLCPVDISDIMLRSAISNAHAKVIKTTKPIRADFETQLKRIVSKVPRDRRALYTVYATVCNFDRDRILSLLSSSVRDGDFVMFSTQLYLPDKMHDVVMQYSEDPILDMGRDVLMSLGFERSDVTVLPRFNSARMEVEIYAVVNRVPAGVDRLKNIRQGDEIVVLYSHKPRLLEFEELASKYFDGDTFTDKAGRFATFIGRPRRIANLRRK